MFFIVIAVLLLICSGSLLLYNNKEEKEVQDETSKVVSKLEDEMTKYEEVKSDENGDSSDSRDLSWLDNGISLGTKYSKKINNINYIGILYFPTISNLAVPVIDKLDDQNLKKGSCRYYGNIDDNNLVIGGHNYKSIFGKLDKNLNLNDTVYFKQLSGDISKYTLSEKEILKPEEVEKLVKSDYDMTIFTCTYDGQNRIAFRFEY